MKAYIDIVGDIGIDHWKLSDDDLQAIGAFTRGNVSRWLESHLHADDGLRWVGLLPAEDFHAVCGDIEIPWATEENKAAWADIQKRGWWPGDSIENSKCA